MALYRRTPEGGLVAAPQGGEGAMKVNWNDSNYFIAGIFGVTVAAVQAARGGGDVAVRAQHMDPVRDAPADPQTVPVVNKKSTFAAEEPEAEPKTIGTKTKKSRKAS